MCEIAIPLGMANDNCEEGKHFYDSCCSYNMTHSTNILVCCKRGQFQWGYKMRIASSFPVNQLRKTVALRFNGIIERSVHQLHIFLQLILKRRDQNDSITLGKRIQTHIRFKRETENTFYINRFKSHVS